MVEFYKYLKAGKDKATALQQAQIKIIQKERRRRRRKTEIKHKTSSKCRRYFSGRRFETSDRHRTSDK